MKEDQIIEKLNKAVIAAKSSLEAVGKWAELLAEHKGIEVDEIKKKADSDELKNYEEGEEQIIEGLFNGQFMIAPGGKEYVVPSNYASKSKLVQGDKLKLTIKPNGAFIYKQIELIPRQMKVGKLILEGSQYKVLTDEKTYSVLYASVTFFKGNVGDDVAIIVPENEKEGTWAAIENILPAKEAEPEKKDKQKKKKN